MKKHINRIFVGLVLLLGVVLTQSCFDFWNDQANPPSVMILETETGDLAYYKKMAGTYPAYVVLAEKLPYDSASRYWPTRKDSTCICTATLSVTTEGEKNLTLHDVPSKAFGYCIPDSCMYKRTFDESSQVCDLSFNYKIYSSYLNRPGPRADIDTLVVFWPSASQSHVRINIENKNYEISYEGIDNYWGIYKNIVDPNNQQNIIVNAHSRQAIEILCVKLPTGKTLDLEDTNKILLLWIDLHNRISK